MVSKKYAELSNEDLQYIEKLLGKEFSRLGDYNKRFETKNKWSPKDNSSRITRIVDALRSQQKYSEMLKW